MRTKKKLSRPPGAAGRVGLARALSKLGFCSRSRALDLIQAGRVRLNGSVTKNPASPVRLGSDRIHVHDRLLGPAEKIYLVLNKPRGIVTTASDEKGRATVYSLLPPDSSWIAPVGRLDQASEGLLLLTNDSLWAARITDPASQLDKTYHVQVHAVAGPQLLESLERGVELPRGEVLKAKHARLLRSGKKTPGSKWSWTREKTVRSVACSTRWESRSYGSSASGSAPCNSAIWPKALTGNSEPMKNATSIGHSPFCGVNEKNHAYFFALFLTISHESAE